MNNLRKNVFDILGNMNLSKGHVSPFGVINDTGCKVEVVFDKDILLFERIGIHPNDNTTTVLIRPGDLQEVILSQGNKLSYIEI